jgi:hypothetical protein
MIDKLDLLLEQVREDHPFDETFVQNVMHDVRVDELRRARRRAMRRPTVTMIAAAALITGGAVAAVVGTNPAERDRAAEASKPPAAIVEADPPTTSAPKTAASVKAIESPDVGAVVPEGFTTKHTSFVLDEKTGLRLQTETYSNIFQVNREHRVTLTLENTGRHPISISAAKGCGLQVMASQNGDPGSMTSGQPAESNDLAWVCAGSSGDPRVPVTEEQYVLAPGERRTADSMLRLRDEGDWSLIGVCRCTYTQVHPSSPMPKKDLLSDVARRALPSPLLPEQPDGENLSTPAIRVIAT